MPLLFGMDVAYPIYVQHKLLYWPLAFRDSLNLETDLKQLSTA